MIEYIIGGVGALLTVVFGALMGYYRNKAKEAERRADSAAIQVDIYKEADDAEKRIKEKQQEARDITVSDIDRAIDDWNNGV